MSKRYKDFKVTDTSLPEGLEALRRAVEVEKEEMGLYMEYARKTSDPTGKNIFISLARDEEGQIKILEEQIALLEKRLPWKRYEQRSSEIQDYMSHMMPVEKREKSTSGKDQLGMLRAALAREREAIDFFRTQARELGDENAKDMYRKLAAMDEAHYDMIQAQIDAIEGTGFWFGIPEFSLV